MFSKDCCSKKHVTSAIAVAVFIWLFDFLVHGNLLKETYQATAHMWRPESAMMDMMWMCIAYHLAMAFVVTVGYFCWRENVTTGKVSGPNCPFRKSAGFGMWVGVLLGLPQLMTYMWLPLDNAELPISWALSEFAKWTLAGLVLAKLYEMKGK